MKFKRFLTESTIDNSTWDKIINDCKPYLEQIKKASGRTYDIRKLHSFMLITGRRADQTQDVFLKKIRNDRIPRDTPKFLHDYMDELFEKKFGVKARSQSIFCFNGTENSWGNIKYIVFPRGNNFKCIGNVDCDDLTLDLSDDFKRQFQIDYSLFSNFNNLISRKVKHLIFYRDRDSKRLQFVYNSEDKSIEWARKKLSNDEIDYSSIEQISVIKLFNLFKETFKRYYLNGYKELTPKDWAKSEQIEIMVSSPDDAWLVLKNGDDYDGDSIHNVFLRYLVQSDFWKE